MRNVSIMFAKALRAVVCASLALAFASPISAKNAATSAIPSATPLSAAADTIVPARVLNGEFCPARMGHWKLHPGGVVAFNLTAHQTRLVSASLEMQTDRGWYTFDVPATALLARKEHWHTNEVSWTSTDIVSAPLYLRLPEGSSKLLRAWVTSAQVLTASDPWYAVGQVACLPFAGAVGDLMPQVAHKPHKDPDPMRLENPNHSLELAMPSDAAVIVAQPTQAPTYSCVHPFEHARTIRVGGVRVWPPLTLSAAVVSLIHVTIMPSGLGNVVSKRVYLPTGSRALDRDALDAVARSTFVPATVFCKPAPGQYLFKVIFAPGTFGPN